MKNNAEVIKGIDEVIKGLTLIKTAIGADEKSETVTEDAPKKTVGAKKEAPATETAGEEKTVGKIDVDQLNGMKYNEFKKFAASLGVKCTGTRDEIMERILALDVEIETGDVVDEPAEEDVKEEAPAKTTKSSGVSASKKLNKTKADEPTRDKFDEQAEEIAKETDVEDIISALADVDVKATKKNAVEKLASALREGLIELDDEDEEDEDDDNTVEAEEQEVEDTDDNSDDDAEEDDSEDEDSADDEEINADTYTAEYDPNGYNDPADMSKKRASAIHDKMEEIISQIEEGEITEDDITSYIEENATEEEIDLLGDDYEDDDLIKFYMELVKRTIDNDGDEHEPADPYEVGECDMCCGHELKYSKKTKKYICEQCGTEYEAG